MQSYKFDDVIDKAVIRKNLDKDLLKSISGFVFKETKEEMSRFSNLRVYLQGLMVFFYGKKRMEEFLDKIKNLRRISFLQSKTEEEQEEIKNKINKLLDVYNVYIQEKKEVKTAFKLSKKNYGNSKESN